MLSACFPFGSAADHPDMVEYTEDEVLEVAKEKYGISRWIFTGTEIMGKASYDAEGAFCLKFYDDGQFSTEFANGDNIETAMQAFAGKNGEILFFTLLYLLRKEPRLIISQKILKRKNSKFA